MKLIRILLSGYGLALGLAVAAAASGLGAIASVLVFWLGGAALTLAFAASAAQAAQAAQGMDARAKADDDAMLVAALRRWEADRLTDGADAKRLDKRTGSDR